MIRSEDSVRTERIDDFLSLDRPLDCEEGRRLGCATFCCSLIVRLASGERDPGAPERTGKRCVDKHPDTGRCVYMDPASGLCAVYAQRPEVCRSYDCRTDPLLPVVFEEGFRSLAAVVTSLTQRMISGR